MEPFDGPGSRKPLDIDVMISGRSHLHFDRRDIRLVDQVSRQRARRSPCGEYDTILLVLDPLNEEIPSETALQIRLTSQDDLRKCG